MNRIFTLLLLITALSVACNAQHVSAREKQKMEPSNAIIEVPVNLRIVTSLPAFIIESSGLAINGDNELWTHEDSGSTNELFSFDTTGQLLRTLRITNANNIDWEDLAVDNQGRFYICDVGNNNNRRKDLVIYRIPNPDVITGNQVNAETIRLEYEDQTQFPPPSSNRNYDVEGVIWNDDSLFLFTKNRSNPLNGYCKMYKLPAEPGEYIAELIDSVFIGSTINTGRVTAADIHPVTGELVLLTPTKIVSFSNYPGNRFFQGERVDYIFNTVPGQVEGLAFASTNRLYMTEERSSSSSGFLYEIVLPDASGTNNLLKPPPLYLHPNPATDYLTITCDLPDNASLEIYDVNGKLLYRSTLGHGRTINIAGFQAGTYLLLLINNDQRLFRRWIKH